MSVYVCTCVCVCVERVKWSAFLLFAAVGHRKPKIWLEWLVYVGSLYLLKVECCLNLGNVLTASLFTIKTVVFPCDIEHVVICHVQICVWFYFKLQWIQLICNTIVIKVKDFCFYLTLSVPRHMPALHTTAHRSKTFLATRAKWIRPLVQ